jgi:DNA modification methylase
MVWAVNLGSLKNHIVLDPFLGSGTTAVACEKLGRKWIGCEISEKYCSIAARRIASEAAQLKLF